ncbi:MAG: hypothetical protein ACXAEU_21445 [Candidatus Hodarchaeales archaeon]|jgi:penicillin V acylase-like amidase (Ntn superfamily)
MILSDKKLKKTLFLVFFLASFIIIKSITSCTNITVSYGDKVFFGNNEDWYDPNTYLWFNRHSKNDFGGVYMGYANLFPEGGMNEKGLCYDANALPAKPLTSHPELPHPPEWIVSYMLKKCSIVAEVIEMAQKYNWGSSLAYQTHFADASGDAVLISAGTDGELNFTCKPNGEGFLIATNFNLADPSNGWSPCWRYDTATAMLNAINPEENITIDFIRNILDAVHQEGTYATKYSNIFDLVNRDIYVYTNSNFNEVVKLDLDEELSREELLITSISDLFKQSYTESSDQVNTSYQTSSDGTGQSSATDQTSSEESEQVITTNLPFGFAFILSFFSYVIIRKKR